MQPTLEVLFVARTLHSCSIYWMLRAVGDVLLFDNENELTLTRRVGDHVLRCCKMHIALRRRQFCLGRDGFLKDLVSRRAGVKVNAERYPHRIAHFLRQGPFTDVVLVTFV
jgi:hypothetical protein